MALSIAAVAAITALLGAAVGVYSDQVNRAYNTNEAEKTRVFNREERQSAEAFNAAEAQKNRDWQEYMTSTAHQREVADLKAAGLNPILSVNSGAGAGTGATAVSPFGGSSAQATSSNSSAARAVQAGGQMYSTAMATDLELKLKQSPRFEDSSTKYYRDGKLVREVLKKGTNGMQ